MTKQLPLAHGKFVLVDDDVFAWASQYKWGYVICGEKYLYVSRFNSATRKREYLHRAIMQTPPGMVTDHINGDTLDCRSENMRSCTMRENFENKHAGRPVLRKKRKDEYTTKVALSEHTKRQIAELSHLGNMPCVIGLAVDLLHQRENERAMDRDEDALTDKLDAYMNAPMTATGETWRELEDETLAGLREESDE